MGRQRAWDRKLNQFEYTCSRRHRQLGCILKGLRELDEFLQKAEKKMKRK